MLLDRTSPLTEARVFGEGQPDISRKMPTEALLTLSLVPMPLGWHARSIQALA
jgi:hypothetical protein